MKEKYIIFTVLVLIGGYYLYTNFIQSNNSQNTTINLYFYNLNKDEGPNGTMCSEKGLVEVKRSVSRDEANIEGAIKLLLKGGIMAEEMVDGTTTEFPLQNVELQNVEVRDSVVYLTFSDPLYKTSGGSCRVSILRAQIEATAKQFGDVGEVRFIPEELFQP